MGLLKGIEAKVRKEIKPLEAKMDIMCGHLIEQNRILEQQNKLLKQIAENTKT